MSIVIRRLEPGDEPLLRDFVARLSPRSRQHRFHATLTELPPSLAERFVRNDGAAVALGAFVDGVMIGEARLAPSLDVAGASEFALAVADDWHRQGIGGALLRALIAAAEAAGVERLHGDIQRDNGAMLRLARKLGFISRPHPDGASFARLERVLAAGALQAFRRRRAEKARGQTEIGV
jgi:GNAT superfamily N-acetyltransferase